METSNRTQLKKPPRMMCVSHSLSVAATTCTGRFLSMASRGIISSSSTPPAYKGATLSLVRIYLLFYKLIRYFILYPGHFK
jgi:hypothetical protein